MNGLPYYKSYPRDFIEGTIGMPFEIKAAYRLVLDLIYMQGGALVDDARYISGLLGCSVKKWKAIRDVLVAAGKIEVRDGYLGNNRADKELETLAKLQDKQRENRRRSNKNKDLQSPRFDHTEPDTDKSSVEAKASPGAEAPPDPEKVMFDSGRRLLTAAGKTPAQAGSLLGKWRKDHGAEAVIVALGKAQREGAIDPVSFIEGIFRAEQRRKSNADRLPEWGETRTLKDGRVIMWRGSIDQWVPVH